MRFRELGWFICVKELLDFFLFFFIFYFFIFFFIFYFYVFRVQCWIN